MTFTTTLVACLVLAVQAVPQGTAGSSGQNSVLGQIPAIMGGNIPSIINPNSPINSKEAMASVGTGKYPAHYFSHPELPNHTIYAPKTVPTGLKTPILLWGNGGCVAVGTIMAPFLLQLASQGITIFANGAPEHKDKVLTYNTMRSYGQSNSTWMTTALNWATAHQAQGKEWAHLDLAKVGAGGQSCGGMEAAVLSSDARIRTLGIFNSGSFGKNAPKPAGGMPSLPKGAVLPNGGDIPDGSKFKVPAFFFLGGETDIATPNGKRDFEIMQAGVPGWLGIWAPGGHGGTYNEVNGGKYGIIGSHWLKLVFFGDKESAEYFKDDKALGDGWTELQKKSLDKIPVV